MRAVLWRELSENSIGSTWEIDREQAHHLIKVIRIRASEEVLALNGVGLKAICSVYHLTKNEITIRVESLEKCERYHQIEVAFGIVKSDAISELVKKAVELGVVALHPLLTEYSQQELPDSDRLRRVMESSLAQSNNPYLPLIERPKTIEEFLIHSSDYDSIHLMSWSEASSTILDKSKKTLLVIGPEGGFTAAEEQQFIRSCAQNIHLPTPIMRTQTAIVAGVGYLLGKSGA